METFFMQNELDLFKYRDVRIDSREIVEITGKRHADICRDIRNQLEQQEINERNFASVYKDLKGEMRTCYFLDYEQLMILISGYSIPLRAKIIKRWTELEQQNKPSLPNSFAEALKLAYEQQLVIEQKEAQLKLQAPKVEYCNKVLDSKSCFTATQIASGLGLTAQKLNKFLCYNKIQFKQSGQYLLYSKYKDLGYTGIRTVPYFNSKGEKETKHETVWTEKGREFITGVYLTGEIK